MMFNRAARKRAALSRRNFYMTKRTQLNKARRAIIEEYGFKHIESSIDRTRENELLQQLIGYANEAIRAKYPEADMAVLRKYEVVRTDHCLRFQFPSGRVDGRSFPSDAPSPIYRNIVVATRAKCSPYRRNASRCSTHMRRSFRPTTSSKTTKGVNSWIS